MISVVIPTYNRSDTIVRLLEDLDRQEGVEFEVIVVDDCSPENPIDMLAQRFPRVVFLRNPTNSGPAVTRNRGIRAARGEIIVGFDNDVSVPDRATLAKVESLFSGQPKLDGIAFRILQPDGISDDHERWWHPVPIGRYAERTFLTSYFSGTAYAFRRKAVLRAGLFPEILFMHYEEVALALRVIDQGGTIVYCPEVSALHHAHRVSRRNEVRTFYRPRNQVLVAAACFPAARAVGYIAPRLAWQFLRALRYGYLPSYLRALRSAADKLPGCLKTRQVLKPATFKQITAMRKGVTLYP
jgi:GT2 family glycosyltransferase